MTRTQCSDAAQKANTLLISSHLESPITRLQGLLGGRERLEIFISNPVKVQGDRRGVLDRLRYYWIDPLRTMLHLLPRLHRYRQVICYYHRMGYAMGIYRLLRRGSQPARSVWVGFAPIPRRNGAKGWLKETLTYLAVRGHSVIVCNSKTLLDSLRDRFPLVKDRLVYVRWGGGSFRPTDPDEREEEEEPDVAEDSRYVFCGGRTNRDFETVLTAVRNLGWPAVFVVAKEYAFKGHVPENVTIYRDVSSDKFQRLLSHAEIVVIALDRPDISSGQVVLCRAMQSARPIIVTQAAGIEDYVTDGRDALCVRSHDPAHLAERLRTLRADEGLRQKLSVSARKKYEDSFNAATFAQDMFTVLSGIEGWER